MYRAALFDLDGTLTDSLNLSVQSFIYTIQKHLQKQLSPQEVLAMFGPPEEIVFAHLEAASVEAMMNTYLDFYRREHKKYARLYREIIPALELLESRKIHRAIITGKGDRATEITLAKTGLDKWFSLVITGSCIKSPKPNPEGIFRALDKLDVPPVEAFYLGDSPGDMETAHRAGVLSLAALWGAQEKEAVLAQHPDHVFHTPGQFFSWLQQNC